MARMTKLQIDYVGNKINNKIKHLIVKKSRETAEAGKMTLNELEKAMSNLELVKWAKSLPKTKLVSMINEQGLIKVTRPCKGYNETVIDQIRTAAGKSCYDDFNAFVENKKIRQLLKQIEQTEKELSDYEKGIRKEAEELMDTMVLSGSANGVKYAIDRFMEK